MILHLIERKIENKRKIKINDIYSIRIVSIRQVECTSVKYNVQT